MSWSDPIDLYCERTSAAFWAEPVNAISNLGFLLAAAAAFINWRRRGADDYPVLAVILAVTLVGVGSFLFHTFANRGVELLDVIPIGLLVLGYIFLALRRFLRLSLLPAAAAVGGFMVVLAGVDSILPATVLNGSGDYLASLAVLIVIGVLAEEEAHRRGLLVAALIFAVSLALRSLDLAACTAFPIGTHFIWHLLSAIVLYLLVMTAMDAAPRHRQAGLAAKLPLRA